MIRYAVKFEDVKTGEARYEAIGLGTSPDRQYAHLYTTLELAEKKAAQYRKGKQWWKNVEVIPVEVIWK